MQTLSHLRALCDALQETYFSRSDQYVKQTAKRHWNQLWFQIIVTCIQDRTVGMSASISTQKLNSLAFNSTVLLNLKYNCRINVGKSINVE